MKVFQAFILKIQSEIIQTAKKSRLTPAMKSKRPQFANNLQHCTAQQCEKVLSTFQQFVVQKRFVRRPPGKRFDDRYTISTVKHYPSQIVWGGYVQKWYCCSQFLAFKSHNKWAKIRANTHREAITLHASSQL